jgi:hypothetical protein
MVIIFIRKRHEFCVLFLHATKKPRGARNSNGLRALTTQESHSFIHVKCQIMALQFLFPLQSLSPAEDERQKIADPKEPSNQTKSR